MKKLLFFLILFLFSIATAHATFYVPGVSTYATSGADMAGMLVSIDFESAADVVDAEWAELFPGSDGGGVSGSGWGLSYAFNDTFPWAAGSDADGWEWSLYSDEAITSFTINAFAGLNMFDILFEYFIAPVEYTPGSEFGWFLDGYQTLADFGTVTYDGSGDLESVAGNGSSQLASSGNTIGFAYEFTDPIALTGSTALGDVWGKMKITFDNATAFDRADPLEFRLDTDLDIRAVPEPATMFLLGIGLLGLAGFGSRLRRSKRS